MTQSLFPGGRSVYCGQRFAVVEIDRGDGQTRQIVVHPGAVVVLPLLDDRTAVLIRNDRPAARSELWELPAGTLEPPEPPEVCAGRELIEETGYRAGRMTKLAEFYTSPGICTELMHAFVARELEHVGQALEAGERIVPEALALSRVMRMIRQGEIRDAKTIATLLWHAQFAKESD